MEKLEGFGGSTIGAGKGSLGRVGLQSIKRRGSGAEDIARGHCPKIGDEAPERGIASLEAVDVDDRPHEPGIGKKRRKGRGVDPRMDVGRGNP